MSDYYQPVHINIITAYLDTECEAYIFSQSLNSRLESPFVPVGRNLY